ncbi:hypothetical protein [Halorhodospira halophila]|nr:hypothetical protein [Halorhodospira halophila]
MGPPHPVEYLLLLIEAINQHERGQALAAPFAYPWSDETLEGYVESLRRLPPSLRCRSANLENGDNLIDPPTTPSEKKMARRAWQLLHGNPETREKPGFTAREQRKLIESYLEGHQPEEPLLTVHFHRLPDLKRWERFSEGLGIAEAFVVHHHPSRNPDAGSPSRQHAYWQNALKTLCIEPSHTISRSNRDKVAARGEVVVKSNQSHEAAARGMYALKVIIAATKAITNL